MAKQKISSCQIYHYHNIIVKLVLHWVSLSNQFATLLLYATGFKNYLWLKVDSERRGRGAASFLLQPLVKIPQTSNLTAFSSSAQNGRFSACPSKCKWATALLAPPLLPYRYSQLRVGLCKFDWIICVTFFDIMFTKIPVWTNTNYLVLNVQGYWTLNN